MPHFQIKKLNQTKLFPLKSVSDVLLSLMQSVVLTPNNCLGFRVSKIIRMCNKISAAFSNGKNQTKLFPLKSVSDVLLSLMQSVVLFVGKYCFQYLHWFWFHLVSETEENIWGRMDLQAWRINGENLFWSIQVFEWCFYILSQNSCGMSVCVAFLFLHFVRIGSSQELFHSLPDSLYQVGIFVED